MRPLDLSLRAPRSPRVELGGLPVLARTIDRARASLPGGNLGQYDPVGSGGLSNIMLDGLGINPNDFVEAVTAAVTDQDVLDWVEKHSDSATWRVLGQRLSQMRLADVPPERRAYIDSHYPRHIVERAETGFDLLDDDDRESFSSEGPPSR